MTAGRQRGVGLVELMLALLMAALLTTSLVQAMQAGQQATAVQQQLAGLQADARYALASLAAPVQNAGYTPEPWLAGSGMAAVGSDSQANFNSAGDRLALQRLSPRNCFGTLNSVTDVLGQPRYYLLRDSYWVLPGGRLVRRCSYGPPGGAMVTQVNNQGLVERVERLVVEYAEDSDGDSHADQWVRAGQWQPHSRLLGVRLCVLLASHGPLIPPRAERFSMLGETVTSPADGRLRRVYQASWVIEGQRL
jgi:type II secretory pathway component PulJ